MSSLLGQRTKPTTLRGKGTHRGLQRANSGANCQATSIRSIRSLAPLLDRVLVQRIKAETKTAGGIFLPESSVEKLNEGKVLAVGPGALDKKGNRLPMGVAVGDRVLIPSVSVA